MISLKSYCRYVYRTLGRKTQGNHFKYSFTVLLFRREYCKALNELTNLDNIDCIDKIMYNDVLAQRGLLSNRKSKRQDEYCEPIFLKYLKNEDNNLNKKEETNNNERKISDSLNFPYRTTKSYTLSGENNIDNEMFSESVRYLTPSDSEKVTVPTYKASNFETLAKNFNNSLKAIQMIEPEVENDNISFEVKFGTSDPNIPISSVPCGGCGAMLHCTDPSIPGFLPKEIFFDLTEHELRSEICRRCYFLKEFDVALGVNVSAEEYPKIISTIKKKKAFVILMIDILDFPCSIWPGISDLIGSFTPVIIVANKVDLLIQDEKKFLSHLKKCLLNALAEKRMNLKNVKDVVFISAKTGFNVEKLISSIFMNWSYKGDVYLVGCTNVGKSTLFNTLIHSDLCKEKATVSLLKATISAWPGTTLNLLKFPIPKPTRRFIYYRTKRLAEERNELKAFETFKSNLLQSARNKQIPLEGHVNQTFTYVPDEVTSHDMLIDSSSLDENTAKGLDPDEFEGKWCFDTPGVVNPDQIVNILTTSELLLTMPKSLLIPRNFKLKAGISLFIGGLARLDYAKGNDFVWFTVYASSELPVTVTQTEDADFIYKKLLGGPLFRVPVGEEARLSKWPELSSKTFDVCGKFQGKAAADIVLSSVGWVSITLPLAHRCKFRAWTPEGRGLYLRDAIIRNGVSYRGKRIGKTPAFKPSVEVVEGISVSEEPSEILSRSS